VLFWRDQKTTVAPPRASVPFQSLTPLLTSPQRNGFSPSLKVIKSLIFHHPQPVAARYHPQRQFPTVPLYFQSRPPPSDAPRKLGFQDQFYEGSTAFSFPPSNGPFKIAHDGSPNPAALLPQCEQYESYLNNQMTAAMNNFLDCEGRFLTPLHVFPFNSPQPFFSTLNQDIITHTRPTLSPTLPGPLCCSVVPCPIPNNFLILRRQPKCWFPRCYLALPPYLSGFQAVPYSKVSIAPIPPANSPPIFLENFPSPFTMPHPEAPSRIYLRIRQPFESATPRPN